MLNYLTEQHIRALDYVLLSHADDDHVQGLIAVLASGVASVREVRMNSDSTKGQRWAALMHEVERATGSGDVETFLPSLTRPAAFELGDDVTLEVLAPGPAQSATGPSGRSYTGERPTSNSLSAVVLVQVKCQPAALLPGDLDNASLDTLIAHPGIGDRLPAPLLVFPHHGGRSSLAATDSSDEHFAAKLMSLVRPEMVLFSLGRGRHGTPRPAIVRGIRRAAPGVRIGCTQLSERCATDGPLAEPLHLSTAFAQGREAGRCCTGTVTVPLVPAGIEVPAPGVGPHLDFIRAYAPRALCQLVS
ncbi:MAG: ComEC/Rec2 family competence protein [Pseudonocardiaceae bacterium]